MPEKKENTHEGHRKRLRDKFLRDGNFDSFPAHNALELLLFYSIPRADTNELAHRLIGPRFHVDKVYRARVDGVLTQADADAFARGIPLRDFTALPARLRLIAPGEAEATVQEGKYHQVKRMFAAVGKPVTALHRVRFGPLALDEDMQPGDFRELTQEEAAALYHAAGMQP